MQGTLVDAALKQASRDAGHGSAKFSERIRVENGVRWRASIKS